MVDNPLAKLYQKMVDSGIIVPVGEDPTQFKFPSLLTPVPSFTTYGEGSSSDLDGGVDAELEPDSGGDTQRGSNS
jgi:hypothetical protein